MKPILNILMFKQGTLYLFQGLLFIGLVSCNNHAPESIQPEEQVISEEATTTPIAKLETTEYVCPMRCESSGQDKPGTCPVCNMLLVRSVEVEDFNKESSKHTQGSVYNLESNWITQDGDEIQLENLSEDFQLVCMIFTNCPEACPNLIGNMVSIDEALEPETKEKLKYLLVTIDPDNDTPEKLASYAKGYNLDTDKWTLLHGEKQNIRKLSNLLGVEYKQYDNGAFGHTNYLTLLNRKGEIVYRLHGISVPNEDMVAFMDEHI